MPCGDQMCIRILHVDWIALPHLFRSGRVIVLYVGGDAETLLALRAVLGEQFAGG